MTRRAFRECFVALGASLPRTQQAFTNVLETRRPQLSEVADRLTAIVTSVFKEWRAVRAGLESLRSPSFAAAVADIETQLENLLPPDFIESVPRPWFDYLPRYLKAIGRRVERLPGNAKRDAELAAKVKPFVTGLQDIIAQSLSQIAPPQLTQLRWMIEEYRVSLFAQELKTMIRVSDKRVAEQMEAARVELQGEASLLLGEYGWRARRLDRQGVFGTALKTSLWAAGKTALFFKGSRNRLVDRGASDATSRSGLVLAREVFLALHLDEATGGALKLKRDPIHRDKARWAGRWLRL